MNNKKLKKISAELKKASALHKGQAAKIDKMIKPKLGSKLSKIVRRAKRPKFFMGPASTGAAGTEAVAKTPGAGKGLGIAGLALSAIGLASRLKRKKKKKKKPEEMDMTGVGRVQKKPMMSKRAQRKNKKAAKKIAKANEIARANMGPGKRAGAARTAAVRKLKAAQRKTNKIKGEVFGKKGKARRNPIKVENQKKFGKKGARAMKLEGKAQSLVGSKKRVAKRTKHLAKRINRINKRIK